MRAVKYDVNPVSVPLDPFGLGAQRLIFREEHIGIAETVSLACRCLRRTGHAACRNRAGQSVYKGAVADRILNCFFKRSAALSVLKNSLHIGVAQEFSCRSGLSVKYVVFHIIISFVIAVFHLFVVFFLVGIAAFCILNRHTDHGIHCGPLLFCEGVEYFFDCLVVASAGLFICHFDFFLLFGFVCVVKVMIVVTEPSVI